MSEGHRSDFLADVLAGMAAEPKTLPCKYFYDAEGSRLFEEICGLDEYYLTRADLEATRRHVEAIASLAGPGCLLVELGSGASIKTRILLDHLRDVAAYVPIDISEAALAESVAALAADYPALEVLPVLADYTSTVPLPEPERRPARTLVYFPGSTIGNFHPPDAVRFLARIARAIGDGGAALVGVDLKKDAAVLERAYDDARGVTARFNKNLLARINRELGADFDLGAFRHAARYDATLGRIEMHLVSERAQEIHIGGARFALRAGETIRSEESYKYARDEFERVAGEAGLEVKAFFTDARALFSLQYLEPRSPRG
jgi:L-histidine Nalpha-methyltransferase